MRVLLRLILILLIASVAASQASTSDRNTTQAEAVVRDYLDALRAQDLEQIQRLSVVPRIPFLLGYEVVSVRRGAERPFLSDPLYDAMCGYDRKRHNELKQDFGSLEQLKALEEEKSGALVEWSAARRAGDEATAQSKMKRYDELDQRIRRIEQIIRSVS